MSFANAAGGLLSSMGFGSIGSKMKSSFFSASGKEISGGSGANETDSSAKGASSARGAASQNNS